MSKQTRHSKQEAHPPSFFFLFLFFSFFFFKEEKKSVKIRFDSNDFDFVNFVIAKPQCHWKVTKAMPDIICLLQNYFSFSSSGETNYGSGWKNVACVCACLLAYCSVWSWASELSNFGGLCFVVILGRDSGRQPS